MAFRLPIFTTLILLFEPCAGVADNKSEPGREVRTLKDGDRVVLLGGGFIGGERDFGFLEARLTRRLGSAKIVFRNLGWPGDNVRGSARTGGYKNPEGFDRLVKEVTELKPTVLYIGYGMNESFDGLDGLAGFAKDYRQLLTRLAPLKATVILLSPTYHEDLGRPWPEPAEHNRHLEKYSAAIADIAREHRAVFVDLFHPLAKLPTNPGSRWTTNGIQLNARGYAEAARIIESRLGEKPYPAVLAIDLNGKPELEPARTVTIKPAAGQTRIQVDDSFLPIPGDSLTLRVQGLKAGKYQVKLEGAKPQHGTDKQLAAGLTFQTGAPFSAGVELCRKIAYRNDLYYRRWRPFNDHSRHWGFIGGDFQLWDKQVAEQEEIILQSRRPKTYVVDIAVER